MGNSVCESDFNAFMKQETKDTLESGLHRDGGHFLQEIELTIQFLNIFADGPHANADL